MKNKISDYIYYAGLLAKKIKQDAIIKKQTKKIELLNEQLQEQRRVIWAGKRYIAEHPDCPKSKALEVEWEKIKEETGIDVYKEI